MVRAILAATMLLSSVPNCTDLYSIATHGLTAPTVTSTSATAALDPGGVRLTIVLTAQNPNDFPISMDSVDYTVSLAGAAAFEGTQEGVTIDERSTDTVTVAGVVPLSAILKAAIAQTAAFTVTGIAHVDSPAGVSIDFHFAADGSFTLPQ
jgi:LEA14-like dessication related protein